MAKLLATTYDDLLRLCSAVGGTRKIGWNTIAELDDYDIYIRFHGKTIVLLQDGGRVKFTLAGWPTPTTRERINQFTRGRVYQKDHAQYYENEAIDIYGWYYDYL